ncbi:MAG: hypothetical protein LBQ64_04405, partial [Bacteroidales bacterium]|nr:hypothetical protein [Bacteroidales bacterium]
KSTAFTTGKQLICLYSTGCRFCRQSALKLHLLLKNNHLSDDNLKAIFWSGTPDSLMVGFFTDQKIPILEYTTFRPDSFLRITDGSMPIILFSENGKIVGRHNYVTLNEKEIVDFLTKNDDEE